MAKFDKNMDKELFSKSADFERCRITVSVFSYNGGTPKLQLSRQNKNAAGEFIFAKLGRMIKEEVEIILPLVHDAQKHL